MNSSLFFWFLDCQWSTWRKVGQCSKSCGVGIQVLQRTVQVRAQNGGKPCVGESTKTENCNYHACPGNLNIVMTQLKNNLIKNFDKTTLI